MSQTGGVNPEYLDQLGHARDSREGLKEGGEARLASQDAPQLGHALAGQSLGLCGGDAVTSTLHACDTEIYIDKIACIT